MKRFFLFILSIAIIWIWMDFNPFNLIHMMRKGERDLTERIRHSDISIGYVLSEKNWTRFRIHQQNEGIKVLTNANFSKLLPFDPDKQYWYTIRYRILDHNAKIIADRRYTQRSRLTQYLDENSRPILAQFYMDSTLLPLDTRIMRIDLAEVTGEPYMIQFLLEWREPGVTDVMLRAYIKEKTSELKKGYLWHRYSEEQKEKLAKGNVFPHDLLRNTEKQNLLRAIYRPMAPRGIEGRSYTARELYVYKDMEGKSDDTMELPMGLYVDQYHHGIVPLPMDGGRIYLDFTSGFAEPSGGMHQVNLRWFGPEAADRSSRIIQWEGDNHVFQSAFKGGMLELRSSRPLVVRAYLDTPSPETEITPDPIYVRTYQIDPDHAITYDIHHFDRNPTPFRADFRYLQAAEAPPVNIPVTVHYALLDQNGEVIKNGSFTHSERLSFYDYAGSPTDNIRASEAISRYFRLPPQVRKVRFHADAPMIVNAYNRPFGMVKHTRIPEDHFKYHLKEDTRQVTWFDLKPEHQKQMTMENRMVPLKRQYRPPEDKEELWTGDYDWEAFYPENLYQGRYLFTPFEDKIVRDEQIPVVFRKISTGKDVAITFQQPVKGMDQVSPDLLFFRETQAPGRLAIRLNGKPYVQQNIRGRHGEIALPEIPAGTYRVNISPPHGTTVFINYAGDSTQTGLKRFALRMDHQGLEFTYEKQSIEEEVLSVRFYKPVYDKRPSVIHVHISKAASPALNALTDYTLTNRTYMIEPGRTTPPVTVLNSVEDDVDQGRLFFLPIGQDAPPGVYTIRFALEQGEPGYLVFSKTTLGAGEKRQFHKERELTHAMHY